MWSLKKDINIIKRHGRTFVYLSSGSLLYEINSVGLFILNLIKKRKNSEQILNELACIFPEIPKSRLRRDLKDFVHSLSRNNLIVREKE